MPDLLRTKITFVGPDVAELVAGGVLILFAAGAPPELAEVSVLHEVQEDARADSPAIGDQLLVGPLSTRLTGVGELAWAKVRELGHVVVNFNGENVPERPGELCAAPVDLATLVAALQPGAEIVIAT